LSSATPLRATSAAFSVAGLQAAKPLLQEVGQSGVLAAQPRRVIQLDPVLPVAQD
jgi:hypothetical protein